MNLVTVIMAPTMMPMILGVLCCWITRQLMMTPMSYSGELGARGYMRGVTYDEQSSCYLTCVLFNNEEGVTIMVPDDEYLDPIFREVLEAIRV